jgi:phosphohistidine phosphatase SixA
LGLITLLAAIVVGEAAQAPGQAGATLADQLRRGGYVLVMRHANAPAAEPDRATADPENTRLERQLDETGRSTARAMGEAFRALRIPIGDVLSSPTYRALQSVRFASFGEPQIRDELGEGAGMQAAAEATRSDWLRKQAGTAPRPGTNTVIVTHTPNIVGAFGQAGANVAAGESLVLRPDGNGGATLIARVKITEWTGFGK